MLTVFGLLSALLVYIDLYLATFIAQNLSARLRENLFDHLQRITLDWHDKQKKGDLVQRLTGNIADIEKLVNDGLVDLLAGILMLGGVAIVMSIISKPYTLLSLTIAPILPRLHLFAPRKIQTWKYRTPRWGSLPSRKPRSPSGHGGS